MTRKPPIFYYQSGKPPCALIRALRAIFVQRRLPSAIVMYLRKLYFRYLCTFRKDKVRKVALWRPFAAGDILIMSVIARKIKKIFPHAKITIYVAHIPFYAEIARRLPDIDAVEVVVHPGDYTCDPYEDFLSGPGKQNDLNLFPIYEFIYQKVRPPKYIVSILCKDVGLPSSDDLELAYNLTEEEEAFASEYQKTYGDYFVFHTDCGPFNSKKSWYDDRWQRVIDMQERPVILIGSGEHPFNHCIDLRKKTTIHETAALIKRCKLFVGVVSCPFWFTNIYHKPAVVVLGGCEPPIITRHAWSHYLTGDTRCAPCLAPTERCQSDHLCMRLITPEMVDEKIREVLTMQADETAGGGEQ